MKALRPGAGKSYLTLDYAIKNNMPFCVVVPYNKTISDIKKTIKEI